MPSNATEKKKRIKLSLSPNMHTHDWTAKSKNSTVYLFCLKNGALYNTAKNETHVSAQKKFKE